MSETKNAVAKQGEQQAAMVINNAFIDGLTKQLNEKCKYGMSFPADYNLSNALMGAYLTLKETMDKNNKPLLESCSQVSIANSLMDMATMGLNVQKKQGYFIAYGGKCQFQKSYFGNITIARRYGLKSVSAEIIYDGDDFAYTIEDGKKVFVRHEQNIMNIDNSKIKGAYAVATMSDGSKLLEVMNINQIKQSWQQGYGYKEKGGTHEKFADQMAKKTVINRLCKMITNTYGDEAVIDTFERVEEVEGEDRIAADVAYEISQNANKEEFVIEEPAQIEENTPAPTMADVTKAQEKEPVPAEKNEKPLPSFMTDGGM